MADIQTAIEAVNTKYDLAITLKPEQFEINTRVSRGKDVFALLPMGYVHFRAWNKMRNLTDFCASRTEDFWLEGFEDENNTAWPWNEEQTWDCPSSYYVKTSPYRRKAHLDCSTGSPHLVYTMTNSPNDIQIVEPDNECLLSYIRSCCYDKGLLVPNVMHYIWFSNGEMRFWTFVSLISVIRFMRPCIILFHGPYIPRGTYWEFFINLYPNVVLIKESLIVEVFGNELKRKEHGSDVMRIKALQKYGGLYIDWDSVLVKPVEPLRKYSFTMSWEQPGKLGNQFLMAEPNATFLSHYYDGYKQYKEDWTYNSMEYPVTLAEKYPETIHVLNRTGINPKESGSEFIYYRNSDWSNNYALHFYINYFYRKARLNVKTIRLEKTTIGAACRYILFGRKELCNR